MVENVKKNDFVEIKYSGYANGNLFDSNIEEDAKSLNPDFKPRKTIVAVGQEMVIKGLDRALEGKEIGKDYEIELKPKEAFGERRRDFVKTIPLKAFTEQNVNPRPGMMLTLDNTIVKIITISGARVVADFNNPLSGKDIKYKFKIARKVDDDRERADCFFETFFKFIPEYEIKDKIVVKGVKEMESIVNVYKDKFRELVGKELGFEETKKKEKPEKVQG